MPFFLLELVLFVASIKSYQYNLLFRVVVRSRHELENIESHLNFANYLEKIYVIARNKGLVNNNTAFCVSCSEVNEDNILFLDRTIRFEDKKVCYDNYMMDSKYPTIILFINQPPRRSDHHILLGKLNVSLIDKKKPYEELKPLELDVLRDFDSAFEDIFFLYNDCGNYIEKYFPSYFYNPICLVEEAVVSSYFLPLFLGVLALIVHLVTITFAIISPEEEFPFLPEFRPEIYIQERNNPFEPEIAAPTISIIKV